MFSSTPIARHVAILCSVTEPQAFGPLGYIPMLRAVRLLGDDDPEQIPNCSQVRHGGGTLREMDQEQLVPEADVGGGVTSDRIDRLYLQF